MIRLVGCVLAAVVCATISAQTGKVAYPAEDEALIGQQVLALLNAARNTEGAPELQGHPDLDLLAYQHSHEMAASIVVTHYSHQYGVGTETRVKLAFPRLFQFGENVAVNRDAEALHAGLQASDGHRVNRLEPTFTHVGLGVARAGRYRVFLTEVFARVLDPATIDGIDTLYTEAPPDSLPKDEPRHGSVIHSLVTVGAPEPDNPAFWTYRGITAYSEERYADAISDFRRALELNLEYQFARYDLARALIADDQPVAAVAVLDEHLRRQPDDLDAWVTRGTTALLLQDYETAERVLRHVIERRARDASAWYNLGLSLEMQDRLAGAESAYRQALHLDSTLTAVVVALARIRR